jgi:ABC-type Na+ efflux pump permease subunit
MTKLGQIIKKNMLLLLRSRSSAFVILLGPLFIVLLIGLALTTSSSYDLAVGYTAKDTTELTGRFVQNLEAEGFMVESFDDIEECAGQIRQGTLQTCILFPENFTLEEGKTNEVVFYVDQSRTNFVYQIIDSVTSNLGVEAAEISKDLTEDILTVLWKTDEGLTKAVEKTVTAQALANGITTDSDSAASSLKGIDLKESETDLDPVEESFVDIEDSFTLLRNQATSLVDDGRTLEDELDAIPYASDPYDDFKAALTVFESAVGDAEDASALARQDFDVALEDLSAAVEDINDKMKEAGDARDDVSKLVTSMKAKTTSVKTSLDELKVQLESLSADINTLKVTSSATISRPITTKIEYVSSKTSKLSFMFPYLIMLVVMFIGILLSSTLIIMEKRSKSSFRTFCSPTSEELFMVGNFMTSFIVILLQMGILFAITYRLLGNLIVGNVAIAGLILLVSIVFFILLGMVIGHLLNSQEGATMVSISLASVFLFLSNLIMPLETLSAQFREMTAYNPYVIASETLRKALLFDTQYEALKHALLLLVIYSAAMFLLMVIIKNVTNSQNIYFGRSARKHLFDDPSDLYLRIEDQSITNIKDLAKWLESVDDKTFEKALPWSTLREWLVRNDVDKMLRVKLAGKSRKQMALIIRKELERRRQ